MLDIRTCPHCQTEFTPKDARGKLAVYCSAKCRDKARYQRHLTDMSSTEPRRCSRCKETKPRSEFPGVHGYCRPCHTAYNREQSQKHAARITGYTRRINLRRYGLTVETFGALAAAQDGKCAICQCDEPGGKGVWHVDHDHTCCSSRKISCGTCIRGLLCSRCNIGLGNFKEDPDVLRMAIGYLERYQSRRAATS